MSKVYGVSLSPMVRKVLAVMELKDIEYKMIPASPLQKPEGFEQISPLGKIPAYQDDQITLADSSVICEYLEDRYPAQAVYPEDPAVKARARWLEEYADTELFTTTGAIFFERVIKKLIKQESDEARVQTAIEEKLPVIMKYLESEVPGAGYLFGAELMVADIAIATHFINASYGGVKVDSNEYPVLSAYLQRILQHPVMVKRLAEDSKMMSA